MGISACLRSFRTGPLARSEPETSKPADLASKAKGPMPVPEMPEM